MNCEKVVHSSKSRVLAAALLAMFALPLSAQQSSEQGAAGGSQQITPGVSVDAAHKSSDLTTAVTTEENKGETGFGFEIKQSAEFGGRTPIYRLDLADGMISRVLDRQTVDAFEVARDNSTIYFVHRPAV